MDTKRMAGDYEIIQAISVGDKEIILGHDPQNAEMPYMTGFCYSNPIFTSFSDCLTGDNYSQILGIFSERLASAAKEVENQLSAENQTAGNNRPYDRKQCQDMDHCKLVSNNDDLHLKVVIIKPEVLKQEYQLATRQLQLCTGGFGASPNSRGSACFCTNLYSGKHSRFERQDILAVLDPIAVPCWAKDELKKALEQETKHEKTKEASR